MQGLLLIDKPKGITSFGAVAAVRRLTGEKRVGHTGTLDPMATGVLPVLVGRVTALSAFMLEADKEYEAQITLGTVTDTGDITGRVVETRPVNVTAGEIEQVLQRFTGVIRQTPPAFSAIKQNGVPLYKLARNGEEVKAPEREVVIRELAVTVPLQKNTFGLRARVSKGTYIRSLAVDIGEVLGCGATLSALRRTQVSGFSLRDCVPLSALTSENISDFIRSGQEAVGHLRAVDVTDKQAVRFCNGGQLNLDRLRLDSVGDGECLAVKNGDLFLGIGTADGKNGQLRVRCVVGMVNRI